MKPLAFTAGEKGRGGPEVALMTSVLYAGAQPTSASAKQSESAREMRVIGVSALGGNGQRRRGLGWAARMDVLLIRESKRDETAIGERLPENLETDGERVRGEASRHRHRRKSCDRAQLAVVGRLWLSDHGWLPSRRRIGDAVELERVEDALDLFLRCQPPRKPRLVRIARAGAVEVSSIEASVDGHVV